MRSAFFDPLTRQPENIELEQTTLLQFSVVSDCQVLAEPAEKDCCIITFIPVRDPTCFFATFHIGKEQFTLYCGMILNPSLNRRGNFIHTGGHMLHKSSFNRTPFFLISPPNICPWNSFVGNLLSVELGGQGLDHMAYTVASWGKRRRSSLAGCAFWRTTDRTPMS